MIAAESLQPSMRYTQPSEWVASDTKFIAAGSAQPYTRVLSAQSSAAGTLTAE